MICMYVLHMWHQDTLLITRELPHSMSLSKCYVTLRMRRDVPRGRLCAAGDVMARTGQGADFVDQGDRGQSPKGELPSHVLPAGLRLRQSQDHGAISRCFGKSLDAKFWQRRRALSLDHPSSAVRHHHSSMLASYKALLRRKRRAWERQSSEGVSWQLKSPASSGASTAKVRTSPGASPS